MKKATYGLLGFLIIILGFGIWNFSGEERKDPLSKILLENEIVEGDSVLGESLLKGDYITDTISAYNGPISTNLQNCINNSPVSLNMREVRADYKGDPLLEILTRDGIIREISPVLGYAVNNNQLNWTWNADTRKYVFKTYPGQESLWYCYFKNETNFFKYFLNGNTLAYDVSAQTPTPTPLSSYSCSTELSTAKNNPAIDASGPLSNCVNATGSKIAEIPAGKYYFHTPFDFTSQPIVSLRTAGKDELMPPCTLDDDSCAMFIVHDNMKSRASIDFGQYAFRPKGVANRKLSIDHIIFNGNKYAREIVGNTCQRFETKMSLFFMDGGNNGGVLSNNVFKDTPCGTALEVRASQNVTIKNNLFAYNGDHNVPGKTYLVSDGLTVISLFNGIVSGNKFIDNTDVQLIFGEGTNTLVENNTIEHSGSLSGASFVAVMYSNFNGGVLGNFAGGAFKNNVIDCGPNKIGCAVGLYLGEKLWHPTSAPISNIVVENNTIKNAPSAIMVFDASGVELKNNALINSGNRVIPTLVGPQIFRNLMIAQSSLSSVTLQNQTEWNAPITPRTGSIPNHFQTTIPRCNTLSCSALNLYEFVLARSGSATEQSTAQGWIEEHGSLVIIKDFFNSAEFKQKFAITENNTVTQTQFLLEYMLLQNASGYNANTLTSQYPSYTSLIDFIINTDAFKNAIYPLFYDIPETEYINTPYCQSPILGNSSLLGHQTGRLEGTAWSVFYNDPSNQFLSYGPYIKVPSGKHTVQFNMLVDNNTADDYQIVRIEINNATKSNIIASKDISRKKWTQTYQYQSFPLSFSTSENEINDVFEFRVYFYGHSYTKLEKITLCNENNL